jgi:hypothetical protein
VRKRFGQRENERSKRGRYHAAMVVAVWVAFQLVVLVVSAALAALRGLHLWRRFRLFSRTVRTALEEVVRTAAAVEKHAASLSTGTERLSIVTAHLQGSLAQLALLRSAAAEANAPLARLRGAIPSK